MCVSPCRWQIEEEDLDDDDDDDSYNCTKCKKDSALTCQDCGKMFCLA